MRVIFLFTLFIGSVLAAIASAGASANIRQTGNVKIELSVNKSNYAVGETVHIALSLINQGPETVSFQFPTGQMYDFGLVRGDQWIWRWSDTRVFTQAFTTLLIRPGESTIFNAQWDQRDGQGRPVPSGEYELVAVFPAQGLRIPLPTDGPRIRFRISGETQAYRPDVSSRAISVAGSNAGEVLLDSRPVLRIRVAAGGISAVERAAVVANRLRRFLEEGLKPEDLTVSRLGTDAAIMWRSRLLVTADANHARLNSTSPRALASQWRQSLVHALSIRP